MYKFQISYFLFLIYYLFVPSWHGSSCYGMSMRVLLATSCRLTTVRIKNVEHRTPNFEHRIPYFLFLISYFLFPISYFLFRISYFLFICSILMRIFRRGFQNFGRAHTRSVPFNRSSLGIDEHKGA